MLPPPMMNMHPPYNFVEGLTQHHAAEISFQENSERVILAPFQRHEVRGRPIHLLHLQQV